MSAHMNGIPLFILSGNEKSEFFKTTSKRCIGFQGFSPVDVVGSFTKAVLSADNPLGAVLMAKGMYELAIAHRQGPAWCDIPQNIAAMEVAA
jgi:thiamine pyrophosphate-dependent acetolactate synthase large subunit-like protein